MEELYTRKLDETRLDTVLSDDIVFEGEMAFTQPLMIKGKVQGDIDASGELYIAETAEVQARIQAESVYIRGKVTGDISAQGTIELSTSSEVNGDITAPEIVMERGCRFNGVSRMISPEEREG